MWIKHYRLTQLRGSTEPPWLISMHYLGLNYLAGSISCYFSEEVLVN